MKPTHYWIKRRLSYSESLGLGLMSDCGVTAYGLDDTLGLIQQRIFNGKSLPEIETLIEDVDVRNLDQKHVIPNMRVVTERGIWFPRGYP